MRGPREARLARPIWAPPLTEPALPIPLLLLASQGRRDAGVPRGRDPPHLTRPRRLPQGALRAPVALRRQGAALQASRPRRLHRRCRLRPAPAHRRGRRQARGPRDQGRRRRGVRRAAREVHLRFPPPRRRRHSWRQRHSWRVERRRRRRRKRRLSRSRAVSRRRGSVLASLRRVPEQDRLLRRPADAPAAGGDQRRAPLVRDCRVFHSRGCRRAAVLGRGGGGGEWTEERVGSGTSYATGDASRDGGTGPAGDGRSVGDVEPRLEFRAGTAKEVVPVKSAG